MAAIPSPSAKPLVVGANHRSASMMMRDRLFVEEGTVGGFLARLKEKGVEQAVSLSTCDRVEVLAAHADPDEAAPLIQAALAEQAGLTGPDLEGQVYVYKGPEAVRHVFSVTSSLDSLMVGEPQVLGQVKTAHRLAREAGMTGTELEALMQAAFSAAKRVRTETAIGEGPVSIAAAAVQLARDLHGDLDRCQALLLGDGDMGELVARDLRTGGLAHLTVLHPSDARAQVLARELDCHREPFDTLPEALGGADIVLTALGARTHTINAPMVGEALQLRRRKPIFLIDTGIPGDVDPAVERMDGAFLYDLNDLERIATQGRASREAQARDAWRIVDEELTAFRRGRAERTAVPALVRLREAFETAREKTLADANGDAERATQLLVNRLLHDPSEVLKEAAAGTKAEDWVAMEALLVRLFRLDGEKKGGA